MHDLVSFIFIVNFEGEKVFWSSQLELGDVGLFILLDGDSVCSGKMLMISSHDLDEFL